MPCVLDYRQMSIIPQMPVTAPHYLEKKLTSKMDVHSIQSMLRDQPLQSVSQFQRKNPIMLSPDYQSWLHCNSTALAIIIEWLIQSKPSTYRKG
jgi:hypothetical protein